MTDGEKMLTSRSLGTGVPDRRDGLDPGCAGIRALRQPNTIYVHVGKALGLGEKRDREWWYSAEEIEAIKAEFARRAAAKQAEKARRDEDLAALAEARRKARLAELPSSRIAAPIPTTPTPRRAPPPPRKKFHTAPFIEDKDLFLAVQFARKMRREGLATELACSRAARYYGVLIADVARELGRIGARKALKNRVWNAYHDGREDSE